MLGHEVPGALAWLTFLQGALDSIYRRPEAIAAACALFAGGVVLFGLSAGKAKDATSLTYGPAGWSFWRPGRPREVLVGLAMSAIGLALVALVLYQLASAEYEHRFAYTFLAGLVLLIAGLFVLDEEVRALRITSPKVLTAEIIFVVVVVSVFIALNVMDLTSWKYAAVGDEFDGFGYAHRLASGDVPNVFSQREGVENTRPVLGALVDAAFLKMFGGDIFAWKFRLVILAAASLVPFYFLARELFSWRVAAPATAFFASSHYLFAYTHHPTFIDALLPTTLSLYFLVLGLRRNSILLLFLCGIAAGLGFYSFFAGRAIILIVMLYMVSLGPRSLTPRTVIPVVLGFGVMVGPMFASDGWYVIDRMFEFSAAGYSEEVVGSRTTRIIHNIAQTTLAFNYSEQVRHYVSGSLFDPVTAVLYILGIGYAASRAKHPAFRLVLIWWLVALAATGFTSPYPAGALTRLHYVIPVAALLAGLTFDRVLRLGYELTREPRTRALIVGVSLAALMVPVMYLNLHRFWWETPSTYGAPTTEAVAMRAFFSEQCEDGHRGMTIIIYEPNLLRLVVGAYRLGERRPRLLDYPSAQRALASPGLLTKKDGCIAVAATGRAPAGVSDEMVEQIKKAYPDKRFTTITDLAGRHPVQLFY